MVGKILAPFLVLAGLLVLCVAWAVLALVSYNRAERRRRALDARKAPLVVKPADEQDTNPITLGDE